MPIAACRTTGGRLFVIGDGGASHCPVLVVEFFGHVIKHPLPQQVRFGGARVLPLSGGDCVAASMGPGGVPPLYLTLLGSDGSALELPAIWGWKMRDARAIAGKVQLVLSSLARDDEQEEFAVLSVGPSELRGEQRLSHTIVGRAPVGYRCVFAGLVKGAVMCGVIPYSVGGPALLLTLRRDERPDPP